MSTALSTDEALAGLDEAARSRLRRAGHPDGVEPQLATLTDEPFSREGWIYERKLDGMRLLVHRRGDEVTLRTRRHEDRTRGFPELVEAVVRHAPRDAVLDGEVVAFEGSVTSFARLQGRIGLDNPVRARATGIRVHLYLFDLLHLDGWDVTGLALSDRKRLLRATTDFADPLRFTPHRNTHGEAYLEQACARGWEGLIAKKASAPYSSGRSRRWLKLKCDQGQEFVIAGWTPPRGTRQGFGSLLLGHHTPQGLRYAGRVGSGFTATALSDLTRQLRTLERSDPPFVDPPRLRDARWADPRLVAEIAFTEWTRDGRLRHPRFKGLRPDKAPEEVVREGPRRPPAGVRGSPRKNGRAAGTHERRPTVATRGRETASDERTPVSEQRVRVDEREFKVSNLDKVLFPADGITKAELIEHYVRHGEAMLDSIRGRALSLKRYPDGIDGDSFFQKRPSGHFPDWITRARVGRNGEEGDEYVVADQRATLAYLANQGTIELHTMLVPAAAPDRPEEIIFDLDPSKGAPTSVVRRATRRCRDLLAELEVPCRLKSSGSSGFHVHVALDGTVDQQSARAFARDAATLLARRHPKELTVHVRKARRGDRVFVDWLRNSPAQTAIAPYSVRALPGAPVATPMDFDELSGTDPRRWTLRNLSRRLAQRDDPWDEPPPTADLERARASLDAALEELR